MPAMFHKAFRNGKHNKEGWIIGAYEGIRHVPDLEVAFAFPVPVEDMVKGDILRGTLDEVKYYGFYEDISHPEKYDESLNNTIAYGASPRATIALDKCAKIHAWLPGRDFVHARHISNAAVYEELKEWVTQKGFTEWKSNCI